VNITILTVPYDSGVGGVDGAGAAARPGPGPVGTVAVTAYDPSSDPEGRAADATTALFETVLNTLHRTRPGT
jgi:hypothetical protein